VSDTQRVLQDIYDERGQLTPADVVDVATPDDHPLHGRFTWDDTEAARKCRLYEAAYLIRSVKITVQVVEKGQPRSVHIRAFPNISGEDYVPIDVVMQRPDFESALMESMKSDLRELRRKYDAHASLFSQVLMAEVA